MAASLRTFRCASPPAPQGLSSRHSVPQVVRPAFLWVLSTRPSRLSDNLFFSRALVFTLNFLFGRIANSGHSNGKGHRSKCIPLPQILGVSDMTTHAAPMASASASSGTAETRARSHPHSFQCPNIRRQRWMQVLDIILGKL